MAVIVLYSGQVTLSVDARLDSEDENIEPDPLVTQLFEEFGEWTDASARELVWDIRDRLFSVANEPEKDLEFYLLDKDTVNAFAAPGGQIFLFRGLVERSETEAQLASVMAHEMIHVLHGHHYEGSDTITAIQVIGLLTAILSEEPEPIIAGQMISAAINESYGRDAEVDADISGVDLMVDAGFDPLGMLEFFVYLEAVERRRPQLPGNFFLIHPYPVERRAMLRAHLAEKGIEVPEDIYRLHLPLDLICEDVDGYYECTIYAGDDVAFVLAGTDDEKVIERGFEVIGNLREVFGKGIRDYQVYPRKDEGQYYITSDHGRLVEVTPADETFLDGDAAEINSERLENLKYILWKYYIGINI